MYMQEIRSIAKDHKIATTGLSKLEIIRKLQAEEGNFDCYATAINGVCDQEDCKWREDCFIASKNN